MKGKFKLLSLLLAAAMLLSACGSSSSSESGTAATTTEAADTSHLNFGCYMYSASMDPAAYQNAAWQVTRLGVGECLFKFDSEVVAQPWLCDSYTVSDDHLTWTFHIREGVQFSNGSSCDAQAVADSLNRLYTVCATDGYSSTPSGYIDAVSITADTEANTVTIVTGTAYADLTGRLAFPFYAIIDVEGDLDDSSHDYTECVIGTGPYAIASFDTTTKNAELVANEYYWNGEVPYSSITATFIEDDTTKAMALQSGDIDLTENVTSASDLATLAASEDYYVSQTAGIRTGFAYINMDGILSNDALRQAVQMAVDGNTLCEITVGGMYTYGFAVLPSNLSYDYASLTNPYAYDAEAAAALLDAAGIVDTDGDGIRELDGQNICLTYITYNNRCLSDFAEAVMVSLNAIGIDVALNSTDSDTEWMLMQNGEYDLCDSNWTTVAIGDPETFLKNWYGGDNGSNFYSSENPNGVNYCHYENDAFDALFEAYCASIDTEEQAELVIAMEQILIDDAAVLVHGYYNSSMICNASTVTGAEISTIDYYWLSADIAPAQ